MSEKPRVVGITLMKGVDPASIKEDAGIVVSSEQMVEETSKQIAVEESKRAQVVKKHFAEDGERAQVEKRSVVEVDESHRAEVKKESVEADEEKGLDVEQGMDSKNTEEVKLLYAEQGTDSKVAEGLDIEQGTDSKVAERQDTDLENGKDSEAETKDNGVGDSKTAIKGYESVSNSKAVAEGADQVEISDGETESIDDIEERVVRVPASRKLVEARQTGDAEFKVKGCYFPDRPVFEYHLCEERTNRKSSIGKYLPNNKMQLVSKETVSGTVITPILYTPASSPKGQVPTPAKNLNLGDKSPEKSGKSAKLERIANPVDYRTIILSGLRSLKKISESYDCSKPADDTSGPSDDTSGPSDDTSKPADDASASDPDSSRGKAQGSQEVPEIAVEDSDEKSAIEDSQPSEPLDVEGSGVGASSDVEVRAQTKSPKAISSKIPCMKKEESSIDLEEEDTGRNEPSPASITFKALETTDSKEIDLTILGNIAREHCAQKIAFEQSNVIRTLGLGWIQSEDCFLYDVQSLEKTSVTTKREMLSFIAKLEDPLRWLAPVLVTGKIMVQRLWITGLHWDDPMDESLIETWTNFLRKFENTPMVGSRKEYPGSEIAWIRLQDAKGVSTPMETNLDLRVRKNGNSNERFPYLELIGGLSYLSQRTRPYIAYAVGILSRYCDNYTRKHWEAGKRVLRYLKSTKDFGITYRSTGKPLIAFSDASWASDIVDRKGVSGHLIILAGAPIIWRSTKQTVTALSTMESEYIALSSAVKDITWVRNLMEQLKMSSLICGETKVFCDNQAAISHAENYIDKSKTRHFAVKYHFVREKISEEAIELYTPSAENPTDFLTKPLARSQHEKYCRALMDYRNKRPAEVIPGGDMLEIPSPPLRDVLQGLNIPVSKVNAQIYGINATKGGEVKELAHFIIEPLENQDWDLPLQALVVNKMTGLLPSRDLRLPMSEKLRNIQLADPQFMKSGKIDLILGANVYGLLLLPEIRRDDKTQLCAQNTKLGWIISGRLSGSDIGNTQVFSTRVQYEDNSETILKRFWEVEEVRVTNKITPRDEFCETLYKSSVQRDTNGRYIVTLPFDPRKSPDFIGNRVAEIQSCPQIRVWRYVPTRDNPADMASRGILGSDLKQTTIWWRGPTWLSAESTEWPKMLPVFENQWQTELLSVHALSETPFLVAIGEMSSTFNEYIRKVAWILRFCHNCRYSAERYQSHLTTAELRNAHRRILQAIQFQHFREEIRSLATLGSVKRTSKIYGSTPFLDDQGILRVGGRLKWAPSMTYEQKHPALLPSTGKVAQMIVQAVHMRTLHGSLHLMLSTLRQKYWMLRAKDQVKRCIRECVTCCRYNRVTQGQLMSDLPKERLTPGKPFSISGVDYAGPVNLRLSKGRGRKTEKGYICLFVCFVTRAVHLELVTDASTPTFLSAFKRFVARRGHCTWLYSDQGTYFVGAAQQLRSCFYLAPKQLKELAAVLANEGTEWKFNPQGAPHFGGLWEAGVKALKYHMRRIFGNNLLTYEELLTVLVQIESCLNSRPLYPMSNDPNDQGVLTPAHFLLTEPSFCVPEDDLLLVKNHLLTRWQLVQRVLQHLWRRWSRDYLNNLQQRNKWKTISPNVDINTLVLIKEERMPPAKWLMGRVVETHPGKDGLVRIVSVRTSVGVLRRPLVKLVLLPVAPPELDVAHQLGEELPDAFRMLTVAYGEATLDRSNVYRWYKMFSEGREDVNDEERAGRPSTSTTDEKINEVEKMILANRRITVREVAEDLNISIGSCHSIFINDLVMRRVAAKFVTKLLNCDQKQHRMNIANEMLDSVRADPKLLQRVITGDEAWVYGYDVETKAQSSQWKLPHEPRPKKARQVRSNVKVLLTVFFDCRGVVHHEFLPQGITVNKEYYLQVMRNLREAILQKRPDLWKNKNWLLHHDNAPAHTSLLVRDLLAKNNTLMMPQPTYSPDLAFCDFFLFPKLKRPMKGRRYATLDEIKTASKEGLKKILKNDFLKCFEDWKNRWHKCIISHGDYFEGDKI
ncbi:hypothetical protein LAZ67_X001901, partial [Cordylochernes scorpioides]